MIYVSNLDAIALLLAITLGVALGGLYFSALWMTVRHLTNTRHPAYLLVSSLVLRVSLLLASFNWVLGSAHWEGLLAALLGFIAIRTIFAKHFLRVSSVSNSQLNAGVPQ